MAGGINQHGSGPGTSTALAEINVTPLVDVMLVLLIIFMVSAPLMNNQGVQVDLPKTTAQTLNDAEKPLILTVNKGRQILIGDKVIETGTLRARLEAISRARPNVEVFIHADQSLPYGLIAQVMAEVKRSKIHRVGLVTDPTNENKARL